MRSRPATPLARSAAVVVSAVLALAIVPPVAAQQTLTPVEIEPARAHRANARADTLDARARDLYSRPRYYVDAARLHRRAALIRGSGPKAVASFRSAAWLYSAAGRHQVARSMMEEAAVRATALGDVESAANSYIDAANLAIAADSEDKVPEILARMHAVLGSPLLTEERRATILRRVGDAPQIAALDTAHSKP